jgi:hypothetical protein
MLTTVASFRDPWQAHLFRLRLEAEGIVAMVSHEHHVAMIWPYSLGLGGVKVQVPISAAAAACSVWDRCVAGEFEAELLSAVGDLEVNECPSCASRKLRSRPAIAWILLDIIVGWWCGMIFPPPRRVYRCSACGARWKRSP